MAQAAIEWTRGRLSVPQRRFLGELPLTQREDDRLYVHSEASLPAQWRYVRETPDAARSIAAFGVYLLVLGAGLLLAPDAMLALFGRPPAWRVA